MKIGAVVLAAGASSRMGRPKALLLCRGKSFLRTILDTLAEAGIAETRIVLGHAAAEIASAEKLASEIVASNPRYEDGMLSSVRCGIRALPSDLDAFFLWPVDHPLVRAATITRIAGAHAASGKGIVLPKHEGRRGHPPLFAARLAGALLAAPDAVGARAVLLAHPDEIEEVEGHDPGVVADVDTPEAYRLLIR